MKKVIIVCAAVLALTSISAFATGSKNPSRPSWPVPPVTTEIASEKAE